MTNSMIKTRVRNRWNTIKYLDSNSKIDLITLLTQSLKPSVNTETTPADKYYGIWGDDGMSTEEFVSALKSERKFNQDIIEL